jgi:hypothetical protein
VIRRLLLPLPLILLLLSGCGTPPPKTPVPAPLEAAIEAHDAVAIADALDALIGEGQDSGRDRQLAYDRVHEKEEPTAAYAYARAMVTGRLVQTKGLMAALLVREMEAWAEKSRALDPAFRDGAASRMLGSLYVLAPSSLLAHGDSEKGLEILEKTRKDHPGALENHLRYAEALIALGDAGPATEPLCKCLAEKAKLRKDDQRLLDKLFQDAGSPACPPAP